MENRVRLFPKEPPECDYIHSEGGENNNTPLDGRFCIRSNSKAESYGENRPSLPEINCYVVVVVMHCNLVQNVFRSTHTNSAQEEKKNTKNTRRASSEGSEEKWWYCKCVEEEGGDIKQLHAGPC